MRRTSLAIVVLLALTGCSATFVDKGILECAHQFERDKYPIYKFDTTVETTKVYNNLSEWVYEFVDLNTQLTVKFRSSEHPYYKCSLIEPKGSSK